MDKEEIELSVRETYLGEKLVKFDYNLGRKGTRLGYEVSKRGALNDLVWAINNLNSDAKEKGVSDLRYTNSKRERKLSKGAYRVDLIRPLSEGELSALVDRIGSEVMSE